MIGKERLKARVSPVGTSPNPPRQIHFAELDYSRVHSLFNQNKKKSRFLGAWRTKAHLSGMAGARRRGVRRWVGPRRGWLAEIGDAVVGVFSLRMPNLPEAADKREPGSHLRGVPFVF